MRIVSGGGKWQYKQRGIFARDGNNSTAPVSRGSWWNRFKRQLKKQWEEMGRLYKQRS